MVIGIGVALLAGARYRALVLARPATRARLFGVGFCTWLQYQSLYSINSLCLWCSLAWVATIVMFCYVTVAQRPQPDHPGARAGCAACCCEFHWVPPVLWIGIIGMLILTRWWDFWTG